MRKEYYIKQRIPAYSDEIRNEAVRISLAQKWFTSIKVPSDVTFELHEDRPSILRTRALPGVGSDQVRNKTTPEHLVSEYVSITRLLWNESFDESADLVPKWLTSPSPKNPSLLHPDFSSKTSRELEAILDFAPKSRKPTVVHGDLCPVNIIVDDDYRAFGLVDLGDMHVGNPMLDIAVLSWTIRGFLGAEAEKLYLEQLGIEVDWRELQYFRLVYDCGLPSYKSWNWIK